MTAPAIRAVKAGRRTRRVTLLTSPAGGMVAPLLSEVDEVLVHEASWMKATPAGPTASAELAMVERLRRGAFDAAVVFTVYSQSPLPAALLCLLAGIPLRLAHCREQAYQLLTDRVPEPEPERFVRHEVRRQLDLVRAAGMRADDDRLAVRVPPAAARGVRARLRALGVDDARPWIALHPGASAESRRYPAEAFAAVAAGLVQRGHAVVLLGGAGDADLVARVQAESGEPVPALAGTTVAELAAALSLADVVVANNSGPMHLAAAVGTPVVALYALTNPQHTPWRVPHRLLNHDVPCGYCYRSTCPERHHDCLRRVRPDAVVRAACELLDETRWRRSARVASLGTGRRVPLESHG